MNKRSIFDLGKPLNRAEQRQISGGWIPGDGASPIDTHECSTEGMYSHPNCDYSCECHTGGD